MGQRDDGSSGGPDTFAGVAGSQLHNQSVLKAVALIGCFVGTAEGKTLTELARRTGMSMSTAYRMLQTLTLTGVLRRSEPEDRYVAGPLLLSLAGSIFLNSGYELILAELQALSAEIGETVAFGVMDEPCVTILLTVPSREAFSFAVRSGGRIPAHVSAAGKIILAGSALTPQDAVQSVGPLIATTTKSLARPTLVAEQLVAARTNGFAISDEEFHLGVRSIGVAVEARSPHPRAAVEVFGPAVRLSDRRLNEIRPAIACTAQAISSLLVSERLPFMRS